MLIGPGIGTDDTAKGLLQLVLTEYHGPVVLDADALNLIAAYPDELLIPKKDCVVTPHLVEMSRLTGMTVSEIRADLFGAAEAFAKKAGAVCVLKDARTVIAYPDGVSFLVASGSSALATAGSGDVLSGIIAALTVSGQKAASSPKDGTRFAALGDLIHACAGTAAGEALSERTVTASDVIAQLHAFL